MQLSVIIVNYNVRYFLEQCLASVRRAVAGLEAEMLVVDNHSSDGSVAYLQPLFPEVHFLSLQQNLGFARANNLALGHCKGQYVLFLNPDTIIAEDSLVKSIAFMDLHTEAGALGIKMIDGSGQFLPESKRGFPSPFTSLCKQLGLHRVFPRSRLFNRYYQGHLPVQETNAVEVLAGAFMLVRKEVLDKVGSFDERFFMYGEDIDLSYRIAQAGWKNYYFADSAIIHFKGESTSKGSLNYVKAFYKAMLLFVDKHFKGRGSLFYKLLLYTGILLRGTLGATAGRWKAKGAPVIDLRENIIRFEVLGWPSFIRFPEAIRLGVQKIRIEQTPPDAGNGNRCWLLALGAELPVSAAIRLMEQEQGRADFWIHHTQTNSLVMSNNKNRAGLAAIFTHK